MIQDDGGYQQPCSTFRWAWYIVYLKSDQQILELEGVETRDKEQGSIQGWHRQYWRLLIAVSRYIYLWHVHLEYHAAASCWRPKEEIKTTLLVIEGGETWENECMISSISSAVNISIITNKRGIVYFFRLGFEMLATTKNIKIEHIQVMRLSRTT